MMMRREPTYLLDKAGFVFQTNSVSVEFPDGTRKLYQIDAQSRKWSDSGRL